MPRTITFIFPKAFLKAAKGVLNQAQTEGLKVKLALKPELGDLVQGTGGARKIRQFGPKGQSRVIYYFHAGDDEVFFLTCYPKNRKSDLTADEKYELRETIQLIKQLKLSR